MKYSMVNLCLHWDLCMSQFSPHSKVCNLISLMLSLPHLFSAGYKMDRYCGFDLEYMETSSIEK